MKPTFKNTLDWEQAQLLMQPTFIRVLDHLRQKLETSTWIGTYEDVQTPLPGYQLCLTHQEYLIKINIWDICFQVCFINYNPYLEKDETSPSETQIVSIDTDLIDETGNINWPCLDDKAKQKIQEIFANLPIH